MCNELVSERDVVLGTGKEGGAAVQRSQALLRRLRGPLLAPFIGLIVIGKALQPLKALALANLPTRFYRDLPEIPIAALLGINLAIAILACLSDVLPCVAYEAGVAEERLKAAEGDATPI